MKESSDIKGLSFIWGKGIFHLGKYKRGYWFDANTKYDPDEKDPKAFGIKIDFAIGNMIRPIPCFWKKEFITQKPTIKEIIDRDILYAKEYFGEELFDEIKHLNPYQYKRGAYNPWFAIHWFVLRIPKLPTLSFSIGTPWRNFHIGSKGYKIDPFTKDRTWCNKSDKIKAIKEEPKENFYGLALSATFRKSRT